MMAYHCRCNIKEHECCYPKCHNGELDERQHSDTIVSSSLSKAAKDVLDERSRQVQVEGETMFLLKKHW